MIQGTGNGIEGIIGQSGAILQVLSIVEKVAQSDTTLILSGETGTGKGVVARAIHRQSQRREKPFVQINCGAIPENLLESELFGHVRGAFTGAAITKPGKFELASGGTVFLDEIGDMSMHLQVKLLRVLEENEFEKVGGCVTQKTDVRVIAATHRDLEEQVQKGLFREDLFYRLYVLPITLPPLKARREDIPLLAAHFMQLQNGARDRKVDAISDEAMALLKAHSWPGNVRELKNVIERIIVLKGEGIIEKEDLPAKLRQSVPHAPKVPVELPDEGIDLNAAVSAFEKRLILQSLEKAGGVKNKAAKLLQINRTTLVEKIKRHNL
jgi:transcriptional regulator with PAS, ATPase and Fis domain